MVEWTAAFTAFLLGRSVAAILLIVGPLIRTPTLPRASGQEKSPDMAVRAAYLD
jgi:hypothetical protein